MGSKSSFACGLLLVENKLQLSSCKCIGVIGLTILGSSPCGPSKVGEKVDPFAHVHEHCPDPSKYHSLFKFDYRFTNNYKNLRQSEIFKILPNIV